MSRVPQTQDILVSPASLATPQLRLWQQPVALGGAFAQSTDARPASRQQTDETLLSPPSNDRGRLFRAFSMPLPSQLGHLNRPHRSLSSRRSSPVSPPPAPASPSTELAHELAESAQMAIQTLLQISPPHLLDPAKEQLSACALQIPTPSISALLTSMKNLNYMSKHMSSLLSPSAETPIHNDSTQDEFDIGEMLQSVGDALSGIAAEAGVELVLFHGDVAMKHVAVRGDESGISYTLAHVSVNCSPAAQPFDLVVPDRSSSHISSKSGRRSRNRASTFSATRLT
jgi:osomolarity two-component system response regulator SSK1